MKSLIRRAEVPRKLQEQQKKYSNGPGNLSSAKLWKRFRRSFARKETIEALTEMQERAKNTISLLVLNDLLLRDKRSRRYENLLKNIKEQWLSSSEVDYRQQFSALADKVRGHAFGEFLFYLIQERLKN